VQKPGWGKGKTVVEDGMDGRSNALKKETWAATGGCSWSLIRIGRARRPGVRGAIVAMKPGNAGGAKGSRKMDAE
jgi:hypothetical protein